MGISQDVLIIVLLSIGIVLVAVGVWAVVEVAILIRKARSSLDDVLGQAGTALGEVSDILDTADKTIQELQPSVKQLPGLLAKGEEAVDALSDDLATADTILADISVLTGTAMNATNAISKGASQATTAIGGAVAKLGKSVSEKIAPRSSKTKPLEEAQKVEARRIAIEERASEIADTMGVELPPMAEEKDGGFFTYPDNGSTPNATDSPAA